MKNKIKGTREVKGPREKNPAITDHIHIHFPHCLMLPIPILSHPIPSYPITSHRTLLPRLIFHTSVRIALQVCLVTHYLPTLLPITYNL